MKSIVGFDIEQKGWSQYHFFEEFESFSNNRNLLFLKQYFEAVDEAIFNSQWRKRLGYIPWQKKKRTIITIYGTIVFVRRIYRKWDEKQHQWRYSFLADQKLQISKYSRVCDHLKFKILEQIASGKRQRDICEMYQHANISQMTINRIVNTFNIEEIMNILLPQVAKLTIPHYLYLNVDETFLKLRFKNVLTKFRIRLVTFHTGYQKNISNKNRHVLLNKRVFLLMKPVSETINEDTFLVKVKAMAQQFYANYDKVPIIIGGDGAYWIRRLTQNWNNAYYVLDKFHAFCHLKQVFNNKYDQTDKSNFLITKKLFETGQDQELIRYLSTIKKTRQKKSKILEAVTYFRNNHLGIRNWSLPWNIGVSAEGDISHIVKWLLGYGAKIFSYKTFNNMLLLKTALVNNVDIISYLKNNT